MFMAKSFSSKFARAVRVRQKFARVFGGKGYPSSGVSKKGSRF